MESNLLTDWLYIFPGETTNFTMNSIGPKFCSFTFYFTQFILLSNIISKPLIIVGLVLNYTRKIV